MSHHEGGVGLAGVVEELALSADDDFVDMVLPPSALDHEIRVLFVGKSVVPIAGKGDDQ